MGEKTVTGAHNRRTHSRADLSADADAAGYSLMEVLIVILVITVLATALVINLGPLVLSLDVEQVAGQVAASVSVTRRAALGGVKGSSSRQFDLNSALSAGYPGGIKRPGAKHPGVELRDRFPVSTNAQACQGECNQKQQLSICVSGQQFCYSTGQSFIFERFSGRLDQPHAIFILSKSRKLAVLVSREGKTEIAELVNGEWHTSTELQQLLPQKE